MNSPLADRMRPNRIEDVAGQRHLLSEGKVLRKIIDSGNVPNLIFYGPSGVGKTTVAKIIAANCGKKLCYLNATTASTADIKEIIRRFSTDEQDFEDLEDIDYQVIKNQDAGDLLRAIDLIAGQFN